jgi:hypothetical protein
MKQHKMLSIDNDIYAEFQNAAKYRRKNYSDALDDAMIKYVEDTDRIREEDRKRQEAKRLDPNEPVPTDILRQQVILESRIRDAAHRIEKGIVTGEDAEREQSRIDEARRELEALPRRMTESQLNRQRELQDKSLYVRYGRPMSAPKPKPKPKPPKRIDDEPEVNVFPFPASSAGGEEVVTNADDGEVISDDGEVVI